MYVLFFFSLCFFSPKPKLYLENTGEFDQMSGKIWLFLAKLSGKNWDFWTKVWNFENLLPVATLDWYSIEFGNRNSIVRLISICFRWIWLAIEVRLFLIDLPWIDVVSNYDFRTMTFGHKNGGIKCIQTGNVNGGNRGEHSMNKLKPDRRVQNAYNV